MNVRTTLLGLASAVTTFLLTGALTLTVLGGLYGESPGVGILGVFAGFVAGLLVGGTVVSAADRLPSPGPAVAVLVAYGTFGVAFLAIAGLSYVNVPGADDVFTFPVHLGVSLVLAGAAAVLARRERFDVTKGA